MLLETEGHQVLGWRRENVEKEDVVIPTDVTAMFNLNNDLSSYLSQSSRDPKDIHSSMSSSNPYHPLAPCFALHGICSSSAKALCSYINGGKRWKRALQFTIGQRQRLLYILAGS
jgi:hypothetical protein